MGITRETVRHLLPLATHTNYVWTINARSLMNFLGMRLCVRAAPEINDMAKQIHAIVVKLYPEIFKGKYCRGYNLGVCPENEVRASTKCPFKNKIPTADQVRKEMWKN